MRVFDGQDGEGDALSETDEALGAVALRRALALFRRGQKMLLLILTRRTAAPARPLYRLLLVVCVLVVRANPKP